MRRIVAIALYQTLRTGRAEYLASFETDPPGRGEVFHALAGGRRGRFGLRRFAPRRRDLGLAGAHVVRRTAVAGRPAVLLHPAPYPEGGVHGDHLAVAWNQAGHGFALSLHFARRGRPATLLAAAEAMSRVALARDAAGEAR